VRLSALPTAVEVTALGLAEATASARAESRKALGQHAANAQVNALAAQADAATLASKLGLA
jgi:hypothetical protein